MVDRSGNNEPSTDAGAGGLCRPLHEDGLLSGYLDGELAQAETQLVEVHLASCPACREEADRLARLREATMGTKFVEPTEREWDEHARGIFSSGSRALGWVMVVIWSVVLTGYGLYAFAVSDEGWFFKTMVFGLILGFALLFISVLADRIRARKTDRYKRIVR